MADPLASMFSKPSAAPAESEDDLSPTPVDAMKTFIDAVKAGDAAAAHSAMESYKTLCESEYAEDEPTEPEYETFSG